ncbi:MAG: NAD(+) synthase [Chloroflexota bacterium]
MCKNVNEPVKKKSPPFARTALDLDVKKEVEQIEAGLREAVFHQLHRQGAVVGISGGVDSSVVLTLCTRVFGAERVIGILLPEKESSPENIGLAHKLAERCQVSTVIEDISAALDGFGCYRRRDEAIRRILPEYQPGWGVKIVLPGNLLEESSLNIFRLVVTDPQGHETSRRLPLKEYLGIVAASNFKQRARMSLLYYHAEMRNFAVIGTANKNEHALGFFVKFGDGGMDVNPIGHLFKSQVYQLGRYLDLPEEILQRTPTTDTYPGGSTQEEFFYRIPFEILDTIWLGYEQGVSNAEIADALGLSREQVERVVADIAQKIKTTTYLRTPVIYMKEGNL